MKRTILYAAAALLLGGCFKSVGYDTDVILKSWVQTESAAELKPAQGVVAYAFEADTVTWTVASYEDALNGVLTRKGNRTRRRFARAMVRPTASTRSTWICC